MGETRLGVGWPAWAAVGMHSLIIAWVALWPAVGVVRDVGRGVWRGTSASVVGGASGGALSRTPGVGLMLRGVGVCLLIGLLSALLGLLVAWGWRKRGLGLRGLLVLLVPMAIPSYLAYTGWGTLRAPGTWLGDWLASRSPGRENAWPMVAGRVQAIGGLALFAWPLSAAVQWVGLASMDRAVHESLELERMHWWRRVAATVWMARGAMAASVALVGLLMMGSAVPLHLAQVETPMIALWRALDVSSPGEQWRVWVGAWPMVWLAVVGGWWLTRWSERTASGVDGGIATQAPRDRGLVPRGGSMMVVLLTVSFGLPVALQAWSVSGMRAIGEFVRVNAGALMQSGEVAFGVALVCAVVTLGSWLGAREGGAVRRLTRVWLTVWLVCGLMPGVLVGVAVNRAWAMGPAVVRDGAAITVLAHMARFGFVAALAGWWLARREAKGTRELAASDGVRTVLGIWTALVRPVAGVVALAGVACGVLSVHEIEATVMVQPPGSESLARVMLQNLHYARDDALGAGVVCVAGVVVGAWVVGWVMGRRGGD